jgi:hypothetical protein
MENTFRNEFDWFRIYTVHLRILHCPKDFLDARYQLCRDWKPVQLYISGSIRSDSGLFWGRTLVLLANSALLEGRFRAADLIAGGQNKQMNPAPSDWSREWGRTVTLDFLSRTWCDAFGILSNPVRNLLLRILIKKRMLSSISRRIQPMFECQSQRTSWTIQCS